MASSNPRQILFTTECPGLKGDGARLKWGLTTCLDSRHAAWPYEIKSLIGSGVRARSTRRTIGRLNRTVAIKRLIYEQADAIRKTSAQRP
jgi:hypothetical protein